MNRTLRPVPEIPEGYVPLESAQLWRRGTAEVGPSAPEPKRRNGHANAHAASEIVAFDERSPPLAGEGAAPGSPVIRATPFRPRDPALIPPRRWIYDRHYIRQFLTETVAPGACGKSALAITEALAIATGRRLLVVKIKRKSPQHIKQFQ